MDSRTRGFGPAVSPSGFEAGIVTLPVGGHPVPRYQSGANSLFAEARFGAAALDGGFVDLAFFPAPGWGAGEVGSSSGVPCHSGGTFPVFHLSQAFESSATSSGLSAARFFVSPMSVPRS